MSKTLCFSTVIGLLLFAAVQNMPAAQLDKGIESYKAKKYQDAANLFQEVVKAEPDNIQAHYYLGLSYLALEKNQDAESELKKAAAIRKDLKDELSLPSESQLEVAFGRLYMEQEKYEDARTSLESAKKIDPENPEAFFYSGELDIRQKSYQEAIKNLEKSISLNPEEAYAYYYIGIAYSNIKRPDKMMDNFRTFLKLAPDAPEANKVRSLLKGMR